MRLKGMITAILLCLATVELMAQQLTEKESMERALQYLSDKNISAVSGRSAAQSRNVSRTITSAKLDADNVYAFNIDGGGFVIASGDSRTLPVLGYSDCGSIDWDNMPDNMRAWLKGYDEAIIALGGLTDFEDGNDLIGSKLQSSTKRIAVEPLVKTHWNQNGPYWDLIPAYDGANEHWVGQKCYVGCVATTMAQIMNYYKWPLDSTAEIPAYTINTTYNVARKDWTIDGLDSVKFDWDNMLDTYIGFDSTSHQYVPVGTDEQRLAVATLMRYCAQAVEMDFSPEGSGASSTLISKGLYSYFGYAPSSYLADRLLYSTDDWEDLIYQEVSSGRPVPYSGFSNSGSGHSFICDGYDGNGLFHFNWGWGGSGDGYYSLSVLNPSTRAVGYSMRQDAVIGIKTTDDSSEPLPLFRAGLSQSIEIQNDGITIYFYYSFSSYYYGEVVHDYAMGIKESNGALNPRFIGDPNDSIAYGDNWMAVVLDTASIMPGESLTIYPMVRFPKIPGSEWQMLGPERFCIHVGKTAEGEYFIYADFPDLEIKKVNATPDDEASDVASYLTLDILNKSAYEFQDLVYLQAVYYGDIKPEEMEGDTLHTVSGVWPAVAFLRTGKETTVEFRSIDLSCTGLVKFDLYSADYSYLCSFIYDFNNPTGIKVINPVIQSDQYYDLNGRRIDALPDRKGIYIKGNKKYMIR